MTCIVCEKPQGSCEFCASQGDPGDECDCQFCRRSAVLDKGSSWDLFANDDLKQLVSEACQELAKRGAW